MSCRLWWRATETGVFLVITGFIAKLTRLFHSSILQIAQNLVTNACKFGGGQPVLLHTSVVPIPAAGLEEPVTPDAGAAAGSFAVELIAPLPTLPPQQRIELSITVSNSGAGMSVEELRTCFEAFKHTNSACGGGSGLVRSLLYWRALCAAAC